MNNQSNWQLIHATFILCLLLTLISICVFCIAAILKKRLIKNREINKLHKMFGKNTSTEEINETQI
jgi:hypothetical protein